MNRFQVITEQRGTHRVYVLRDTDSGASARIVPALGGNCLELRLPPEPGVAPIPLINDMDAIDDVLNQPSRYGIPVLFPWPSGIPEGKFEFEGKVVNLNGPGETKTRHHGYVKTAPWRVVRTDCDNTGAWLTCRVTTDECEELAKNFPSRFSLEITWKLMPGKFSMAIEAGNIGTVPMPMGFGLHPYFAVPFGTRGSRGECRLEGQVGPQWDLDSTFKIGPSDPRPDKLFQDKPDFPVSGDGGTVLAENSFNDVYRAKRSGRNNATSASLVDPVNDVRLTVTAYRDFGTWVFFSPRGRQVMSLEPWTLTANGFNLAAKGISEAGMITLAPGQTWSGQVDYTCTRAPHPNGESQ